MKLRTMALGIFLSLTLASPAFALDLSQARDAGSVGETAQGYVAAVRPSSEVDALVADVNMQRKKEYARISKENGEAIDVVARVAAEQIISNLEAGHLYQALDGSWKKR